MLKMSKQDITLSVILCLRKDWAQDHKISVLKPLGDGLCVSDNSMTLGKLFLYRVPGPKTSLVFWRCAEDSQVINANYAASYCSLQRLLALIHQVILTQQNVMQRRKLVTMTELAQKLSQNSLDAAKRQFAKFLAKSRAGKGWDYITCRVGLSYLLMPLITGGIPEEHFPLRCTP